MNWYVEMGEWSWFFWGRSIPYIKNPEGRKEFVKYSSKKYFILGSIHFAVGVILIPFSEIGVLILAWALIMIPVMLSIRSNLINVASEINQKHAPASRPKKTCQKCGKEMRFDFKICPYCGEKLQDQDVSARHEVAV